MMKVALILGVAGACRREELTKMTVNDIQGEDTFLLVTIPDSKTHVPRTFSVTEGKENWIHLYQKYKALRPQNAQTSRLFLNYKMGKCTVQPVGINTFGAIPKKIASYLKLPNASSFTGHCFRRTSATLLANAGADLLSLKRHGGWRSSTVAEGYVDGSLQGKLEVCNKIIGNACQSNDPCTPSTCQPDDPCKLHIFDSVHIYINNF
ncbi:uncharacterized protein LOC116174872 [Photinus pyralis]|nr:uncharacterized protein LOC116174872 [Photinus pyralis]